MSDDGFLVRSVAMLDQLWASGEERYGALLAELMARPDGPLPGPVEVRRFYLWLLTVTTTELHVRARGTAPDRDGSVAEELWAEGAGMTRLVARMAGSVMPRVRDEMSPGDLPTREEFGAGFRWMLAAAKAELDERRPAAAALSDDGR